MDTKTILIIEDEEDLLELLEYTLTKAGYETIGCLDTKNMEALLDEEEIDLILMDRNLPMIDGALFIKTIRDKGFNTPVVYLSAKTSRDDILYGFKSGGDDYITKPFDTDELIARIGAIIKRDRKNFNTLRVKNITYSYENKKFYISKKEVNLTNLEHNLLLEFVKNPNTLLSREYLLDSVWGDTNTLQPKTVNVAIKRLKEKININNDLEYIKAVRGEGYIFC